MPGVDLIPSVLRAAWRGRLVPPALDQLLGLEQTRWDELTAEIWSRTEADPQSVEHAVVAAVAFTLAGREQQRLALLPALCTPWPEQLDPANLPFRPDTLRTLARTRVARRDLGELTIGALLKGPVGGVSTLLDFGCTGEQAISAYEDIDQLVRLPPSSEALLEEVAGEDWPSSVAGDDPRFVDLLGAVWPGTVADLVRFGYPRAQKALADTLPALRDRLSAIGSMSLEQALSSYIEALAGARDDPGRRDALLARFGLAGEAPQTLQAVGDLAGLSRERIRQLEEQARSRRSTACAAPFLPQLDAALAAVGDAAPLPGAGVARLLMDRGITTIGFSPESLAAAAEFCGRPLPFIVAKLGSGAVALSPQAEMAIGRLDRVCGVARGQARKHGASSFAELHDELAHEGLFLPDSDLEVVLSHCHDDCVVREGWVWYLDGQLHNTFVQTSLRMLAVTTPLSVASLRDGLRRRYAHKRLTPPPPVSVLDAVYRSHSAFTVDEDGMVWPATPTVAVLSESPTTSQRLVEILRRAPQGILDRASLIQAAREAGLNVSSVALYISYSESIERVATGVYAVRGTEVSPEAVTALQERVGLRPRAVKPAQEAIAGSSRWLAPASSSATSSESVLHLPPVVRGRRDEEPAVDELEESAPCAMVTDDGRGTGWVWLNLTRGSR